MRNWCGSLALSKFVITGSLPIKSSSPSPQMAKMDTVPLHELKVSQMMLRLHTERSLSVLTSLIFCCLPDGGETMVSLKAYLRCKQSNHLATGRAHRDWRPHRLNAQVYSEQGWSPSKVKTGQYLPGREINEYRGVVDNLYKFNDLSTKFSSIKECKLCRLFAVAIFNVTSSNEKAPSETAAGQFGANGLQVG